MFIRGLIFMISGIAAVFIALYFLTEKEKKRLRVSFAKNPRDFIVGLYENTKKILSIFGQGYQEFLPPLSYAEHIEGRYAIQNNLFIKLTVKFEEAKYSRHLLGADDAASAISDYRNFLKTLLKRHNKVSLFFKYCLTLIYRKPLFI